MNRLCLLPLIALTGLVSCSDDAPIHLPPSSRYEAELRYTQYGIPHILAKDLGSAGFGQGYAIAHDRACTLADQIIKIRGERARYFGPGPGDLHLTTDFAFRALDLIGRAQDSLSRMPDDEKALNEGYAAGFNAFLSEPDAASLPCAGQPWLAPITPVDLLAWQRYFAVAFSSGQLVAAIAAAQPPSGPGVQWLPHQAPLAVPPPESLGSNGWALGTERSAGGRGMLLANPHFPWEGEFRLWESHLTIPGQLDVYGATLMGAPVILIGFNSQVAWTHTVSNSARFTAYALKIVPGKPTAYLYDGQERAMTARAITLQVRQPDGSLRDVTRTYYSSHYGPIISLPGIGWTENLALTYRDANLDNEALLTQYLAMARARSTTELQQAIDTAQGIPWVHTMATDAEGSVWYADAAATPNLSLPTLQAWQQEVARPGSLQSALIRSSIVLLDGSTSRDEWQVAPGSRRPGLLPTPSMPRLARRDVVFNANDNHWLIHPTVTLEGFSPLHGGERTARSLRTRMNAVTLSEVREGGASGADGRFTLEEVQEAVLSNRGLSAELLRAAVVQRCQANPSGTAEGVAVDLSQACAALAAWDGRFNLESVGPPLWREFLDTFGLEALTQAGTLFAAPFSAAAPVTTPNTLTPAPTSGPDPVLDRLAAAVLILRKAGIEVNTPLGQVQYALRAGQRVPLHGGLGQEGVANVINYSNTLNTSLEPPTPRATVLNTRSGLTSEGYVINNGTSFLMALEFEEGGGVRARALLTLGQQGNSASPSFRDQLPLFSNKQWRDVAFTEEEIVHAPEYRSLPLRHD
ncbi:penicillin acylase family protein [Stigmatella aurantiaca]|uniref:Aculeacin A acylase n=1 Tax=Stigmatella aurantiaca (strain DW4/3-1) TaxID=378806 RepID=Q08Y87_STIAD|nr:penicillin acylase family protein [Stigmatella aurantiaca]ADO67959.1 Penicillin acylase family protein [Stigmatella aurantiaca DW4/3-1]EAU65434.1 aculeacin A acylase [Stigmatella aurantiaca DW4/3-1]